MTPVVVSSMLAMTSAASACALGRRERLGPVADLGMEVVEPVEAR